MSKNVGIGNVYTYDYKLEHPETKNIGFGFYDKDKVYTVQDDNGKVNVDDVISGITKDKRLQEEYLMSKLPIAESTLRFSFGDLSYDPTTDTTTSTKHNTADRAGGGTPAGYGGTWTKIDSEYNNIWDYTYSGHTLQNEFDNGNYNAVDETSTVIRFWDDVVNNPIKIIASNTSDCTNFQRCLQGIYALTEVWELDTSNATNVQIMFSACKNLKRIPKVLDFSKCNVTTSTQAVFQDCWSLEEVNKIILNTENGKTISLQSFFVCCKSLKKINEPLDCRNVTNMTSCFAGCMKLSELYLLNTNKITNFSFSFALCENLPLSFFENLDVSSATNMSSMLAAHYGRSTSGVSFLSWENEMKNITTNPIIIPNSVSTIKSMYTNCKGMKNIDYTKFENIKSSIDVTRIFIENTNVETGMKNTCDLFISKNVPVHESAFWKCGIDTESGRAERALVPQAWGGDAE